MPEAGEAKKDEEKIQGKWAASTYVQNGEGGDEKILPGRPAAQEYLAQLSGSVGRRLAGIIVMLFVGRLGLGEGRHSGQLG